MIHMKWFVVIPLLLNSLFSLAIDANETEDIATLTSEASGLFQEKRWADAALIYHKIIQLQANNDSAWFRLAVAQIELKQSEKALSSLNSLAKSPSFPKSLLHYFQAKAHILDNKKEVALEYLEKAARQGYSSTSTLNAEIIWNNLRSNLLFKQLAKQIDKNARPCLYDEKYEHFDFWIGNWAVYGNPEKTGNLIGNNVIDKTQNGCLINESWTSVNGSTGTSINYYDGTINKWVQHWVNAGGTVINIEGALDGDGAMALVGKIYYINATENSVRDFRGTWSLLRKGLVRQFFEESIDGGKTWYTWFDGYYFQDK